MKPFLVYLPDRQRKKLLELKEKLGISIAEIIRRAIDQFIEKTDEQNTKIS